MAGQLLLVEDDASLAFGIQMALSREGWSVSHVTNGTDCIIRMRERTPDIVVLDIGLRGLDGFEVCREIRRFSTVPILFLTARSAELDRVLGLELGADDYLTKPFSIRELGARVRALHRRAAGELSNREERTLAVHDLVIYPDRQRVLRSGVDLQLTPTQFRLLFTVARRPGRIYTREELLDMIWEAGGQFVVDHVVNVHIRNLREKLRISPDCKELIITVRGSGYKFAETLT